MPETLAVQIPLSRSSIPCIKCTVIATQLCFSCGAKRRGHSSALFGFGSFNSPEAREAPKNHTHMYLYAEESHNMLPHTRTGRGVGGGKLCKTGTTDTRLPHTDSSRCNKYKQILVPLWKRAA